MNAQDTLPTGQPYDPAYARRLMIIFAGMALMVTYVETMVLPAFKQFYTFFDQTNGSFSNITWILSAYLLVGVVITPIFGKLGDLYGKKRLLLIAMSVYAAAVTVAGFTPDLGAAFGLARPEQIYLLIGVRAIQGVGMGMFPLAFAMIPEVFPPARVGRAQGVVSAMFAAGASLGLVGGGWIAETFGWQLTYHTVIPFSIVLVVLGGILLRESPLHPDRTVDLPGVASLGFALTTAMLGITEGASWGWGNWNAATFAGVPWGVPQFFLLAAVGTVLFAWWEPRARNPIVQFASLRRRNILLANLNAVIVGMVMFFAFTASTILIEYPLGPGFNQSELTMGLLAVPSSASMLALGPVLGVMTSRVGPRPVMLLGFGLIALGALTLVEFNRTLWEMAVLLVPIMVGNVAVLIAMSNIIVLSVDRLELGAQTGMNQTFRNLGSALSPILTSTILASFLATFTVATPIGPVPVVGYSLEGFQFVFAVTGGIGLLGLLLSFALRNYRFLADGSRAGDGEGAAAPRAPGAEAPSVATRGLAP
jgi:MFS family permease